MNYSQAEFAKAQLITFEQYNKLESPQFEGQTRVDDDGNYKMYCSDNGNLYYTENNLFS